MASQVSVAADTVVPHVVWAKVLLSARWAVHKDAFK